MAAFIPSPEKLKSASCQKPTIPGRLKGSAQVAAAVEYEMACSALNPKDPRYFEIITDTTTALDARSYHVQNLSDSALLCAIVRSNARAERARRRASSIQLVESSEFDIPLLAKAKLQSSPLRESCTCDEFAQELRDAHCVETRPVHTFGWRNSF